MGSSKSFTVVLVLMCLTSSVLLTASFVKAQSKTLTVPDNYPTIQSAIDHANTGDTILVKHGLYKETLVIGKSISLIGEGQDLTILNGNAGYNNIIDINASHVLVQGFTISNTAHPNEPVDESNGIKIEFNLNDVRITNNTLTKIGGAGILIENTLGVVIAANSLVGCSVFSQYENGVNLTNNVFLDGSAYFSNQVGSFITNNYFGKLTESFGAGLSFNGCDNNTVTGNTFAYNFYGIYLERSSNNYFYDNNFINNSIQVYLLSNAEPGNGINTWGNDSVGNYWSDYTGNGSPPYAIIANDSGQAVYYDYHPLSFPFNGSAMPSSSLLQSIPEFQIIVSIWTTMIAITASIAILTTVRRRKMLR
jgi:parallel beta-helix repeat protein